MYVAFLRSRRASSTYHIATGRGSTERSLISYYTYTNSVLPVPIQQHARKLISQRALGGRAAGWDRLRGALKCSGNTQSADVA